MRSKSALLALTGLLLSLSAPAAPVAAQGFNGCALVRLQAGCSCAPDVNGAAVVTCAPTSVTPTIIAPPAPNPLCDWTNNWCNPLPVPAPAPIWGDACSRETIPSDCSCIDIGGNAHISCRPLPSPRPTVTIWGSWGSWGSTPSWSTPVWTPPAPVPPVSGPRCSARIIEAGCVCTDQPGGGSTMSCLGG